VVELEPIWWISLGRTYITNNSEVGPVTSW
jgi:hypothetical protein